MSSSKEIKLFRELYEEAMRSEHCIGSSVHGMADFFGDSHVVDNFMLARSLARLGDEFRADLAEIDPRIDDMPPCSVCNNRWGGFAKTDSKGSLIQQLMSTINKLCEEG